MFKNDRPVQQAETVAIRPIHMLPVITEEKLKASAEGICMSNYAQGVVVSHVDFRTGFGRLVGFSW